MHHADIKLCRRLVHFHKGQQIVNRLVLPVDLLRNIHQKFPVKLNRNILLAKKGIRQHLHGGYRGLQLVGHICHKFLPGIVHDLHSPDQTVKRIHDMLRFQIVGNGNRLVNMVVLNLVDGSGNPVKGTYQNLSEDHCDDQDTDKHDNHDDKRPVIQNIQCASYNIRGNAGQKHAPCQLCPLRDFVRRRLGGNRLHNRGRYLNKAVFLIIVGHGRALEAFNHFLGDNRPALADPVGIFYHLQISVDNQNPSAVQIGELLQLRINHLRRGVLQIIVGDQMIGYDLELILHVRLPDCDGPVLIILQNPFLDNQRWDEPH